MRCRISVKMKGVETTIRRPGPEDAEALGRMHWASWVEAYSSLLPPGFWSEGGEDRRVEQWRRNLARPGAGEIRVATRGGAVVGFASAGPARRNDTAGDPVRDLELWAMYVLATEYGSGLAGRLLAAVLPPGEPAELWVFEENPRARAFYAKHGFAPDGARHVFGPDLGNRAEIRMIR